MNLAESASPTSQVVRAICQTPSPPFYRTRVPRKGRNSGGMRSRALPINDAQMPSCEQAFKRTMDQDAKKRGSRREVGQSSQPRDDHCEHCSTSQQRGGLCQDSKIARPREGHREKGKPSQTRVGHREESARQDGGRHDSPHPRKLMVAAMEWVALREVPHGDTLRKMSFFVKMGRPVYS